MDRRERNNFCPFIKFRIKDVCRSALGESFANALLINGKTEANHWLSDAGALCD